MTLSRRDQILKLIVEHSLIKTPFRREPHLIESTVPYSSATIRLKWRSKAKADGLFGKD
jgi:hypothetical protein